MKKLLTVVALFLNGCSSLEPDKYNEQVEVTYFNGDKEIVFTKNSTGVYLTKGDLISNGWAIKSGVRDFKIIRQDKINE